MNGYLSLCRLQRVGQSEKRVLCLVWAGLRRYPCLLLGCCLRTEYGAACLAGRGVFHPQFCGMVTQGSHKRSPGGCFFAFFLGFATRVAGGIPIAATAVAGVYILGFIGAALGPETKSKPLPE